MSATAPPDFAALRKASRFAALVTLAGTCAVLASIGFSVWRLSDTETKLAAERKEVEDLKGEVETLGKMKADLAEATAVLARTKEGLEARAAELQVEVQKGQQKVAEVAAQKKAIEDQVKGIAATIPPPAKNAPIVKPAALEQIKDAVAERAELERQLTVLRKEAAFIRVALAGTFKDPVADLKLWKEGDLRRVMTVVLVSPTSRYGVRNDSTSPTGKWYDFTLELSFPTNRDLEAAMKRDIKSVTYELNHPYLKVGPLASTEAAKDFAVKYSGAGTLRNVVVKIDVTGVGLVELDYDMTKAHPEAMKK